MTRFPSIKPMIDRQTIHIKNMPKLRSRLARKTEENTMSTLSDTMMLTLFIASAEQMLCLKTEIVNKAHLLSSPVGEYFTMPWLDDVYSNEKRNRNMCKYFCPGT